VAAKVRLIVWCKACLHRFEPETPALAEQHGDVALWQIERNGRRSA
jgi:hypothetical protein